LTLLFDSRDLTFDPKDPVDIAKVLHKLIRMEKQELSKIGARNAELIRRNFDNRAITQKWVQLIQ
jgi:hypothetical protein